MMTDKQHKAYRAMWEALGGLIKEHYAPVYGTLEKRMKDWERAREAYDLGYNAYPKGRGRR